MSSLPASTANSDSDAAKAVLVAADNSKFIGMVDAQILLAIAEGKSFVSATTFGYVHPKDIWAYYANLGYFVRFPDLIQGQRFQPADLFGEFWDDFWGGIFVPPFPKGPIRIVINWDLD